jgi:hypothetical protein
MRTKIQNIMEGGYGHLARPDPRILRGGTRLAADTMVSHAAGGRASAVVSHAVDHPGILCLHTRPRSAASALGSTSPSFFPTHSARCCALRSASSSNADDLPPGRGYVQCPTRSGRREWSAVSNSKWPSGMEHLLKLHLFCSIPISLCITRRGKWAMKKWSSRWR